MTQNPGSADSSARSGGNIRDLCAQWLATATAAGGIAIGGETEKYRLRLNGVHFHELSYEELRQAAVGLTEILLLPGLNTVIDFDHQLLWSWCGELLLGHAGAFATGLDPEIRELAETTVRASLANVRAPTQEAFERARQASELIDPNAAQFLQRAHTALPYLAFPFLEAVCRRACPGHVDLTGTVLSAFPRGNGSQYQPGGRCSNLADLLRLLVSTVARPELQSDVMDVLKHVQRLQPAGPTKDGYAVLFDWRNSSLHGEASLTTIGGTVLTLALLVALDTLGHDYETHRLRALEQARREVDTYQAMGTWRPSPWSFYPPYP